jgi:type II secretory ATPase GspE/PulE/Tfp pilus assembly ATPase PilB-like protein
VTVLAISLARDGAASARDFERATVLSARLAPDYLERHGLFPLGREGDRVRVATWLDRVDPQAVDDLRLELGAEIALVAGPEDALRAAIRRVYAAEPETAETVIAGLGPSRAEPGGGGELALDDLVQLANEAPVVKLVNLLLLEALDARASDVHLEGHAEGLRVRYRVDGVLQDAPTPPGHLKPAIVSRLKIMADLDIAERRVPQDGRIRLKLQDRQVDVRVATVPTLHGESVVLRLLDKERGRIALEDLGMADDTLRVFSEAIGRPHGIVLATGPTGSGKTTTLYAAVDRIRTGREKILTVEDPVEYELAGVAQVPVNDKVGVTFATALRALLRQDPDVMLVGEIRDEETAEIATHAALTGHLVLSTLHTNDAAGALTRLMDLGVAPYLVASTVEAVLAQRLVRRACDACKRETRPNRALLDALGVPEAELAGVSSGAGCDACRVGIYELLAVNDAIRGELLQRRGAGELRRLAVAGGMRTLRDDGVRLVQAGLTTPEEVLRTTRG